MEPNSYMSPTGKYLKAQKAGTEAYRDGIPIEKNPNQFGSDGVMASWWDSGWQKAERAGKLSKKYS